jgi:fatty acid desaturase
MDTHSEVLSDVVAIRAQLYDRGSVHRDLLRLSTTRPLLDIALDGLVIFCCVGAVAWLSAWLAPLAICVIANRQRALGNILHDAGHRNLCRDRLINDSIARILVAPILFASLTRYRTTHFRHHLALGDDHNDPDFLAVPVRRSPHWLFSFGRNALSWQAWLGSFAGHLAAHEVPVRSKLYIAGWWAVFLAMVAALAGITLTVTFVTLWLVARATVFHLITTFREMCDHFGLRPGGIFSFTRDMPCHGVWRWFFHPRNNGYHLTHHLLPAVPYYRLPQAYGLFRELPVYRSDGQVCDAYFSGAGAVTRCWQEGRRP